MSKLIPFMIGVAFCCALAAQAQEHRGIHQIQSEQYRGITGGKGPEQPIIPLAKAKAPRINKVVYGFDPYWVSETYLHYDLLTHIACFSAGINGDGSLSNPNNFPTAWSAAINRAHRNGVKVTLCVTCFDSATTWTLLNTAANRHNAAKNIVTMVRNAGCDGTNLDFEALPLAQKQNLVRFTHELSDSFHTWNPQSHVSLATPAVDWKGAWDYDSLAIYSDGLFIMAYDYFGSWSATTGPVAPLEGFSRDVLWTIHDYVLYSGYRRDKILAGFPYYGHDWPASGTAPGATTTGGGGAVLFDSAQATAYRYGRQWYAAWYNPYYYYGSYRQCWYDDEISLGYKYRAVWDSLLAGTGMWALSYDYDREELWDLLRTTFTAPGDSLRNGGAEQLARDSAAVPHDVALRPAGWLVGQNAWADTAMVYVHSGSYALKQRVDNHGTAIPYLSFLFQDVTAAPGVAYTLSGWARKNDGAGNTMRMHLEWYNATHQLLRDDTTAALTADNASWVQLTTGSVSAPAGTAFARIKLNIWVDTSNGYWDRWDDISFGPTGAAGVCLEAFTGLAVDGRSVRLRWRSASEQDLLWWRVERSDQGGAFRMVTTLPALNQTEGSSYEITDVPGSPGQYVYRLYAVGTDGTLTDSGTVTVDLGLPGRLALAQNRPNPFRSSTEIEYQLPAAGQVILSVYNIAGQRVRTLVNGTMPAGEHAVRWDGCDNQSRRATAGVYIYQLKTEQRTIVKKMAVLK